MLCQDIYSSKFLFVVTTENPELLQIGSDTALWLTPPYKCKPVLICLCLGLTYMLCAVPTHVIHKTVCATRTAVTQTDATHRRTGRNTGYRQTCRKASDSASSVERPEEACPPAPPPPLPLLSPSPDGVLSSCCFCVCVCACVCTSLSIVSINECMNV